VKKQICGINYQRKTFSKFGFDLIEQIDFNHCGIIYPFALAISKEKVSLLKF